MAQLKSKPSSTSSFELPIYDDAPFYSTLLQQLISQRSLTDSSLSSLSASFPLQPWQAAREAKTRRNVDTKASKGRRLKYTVHEKLQDSMGREDRNGWSERQCDELFAGILGRRVELVDEVDKEDDDDLEGMESLRLFAGV
jgi:protein AATF/BFR2